MAKKKGVTSNFDPEKWIREIESIIESDPMVVPMPSSLPIGKGDIKVKTDSEWLVPNRLQVNSSHVKALISEVIDVFSQELRKYLDQAVEADVWATPDPDLVDTGSLRDSLQITVRQDGADISYDVPYAAFLHYGGYIMPYGNENAERVYVSGRPWIEAVLFGSGPFEPPDFQGLWSKVISKYL